MPLESPDAIIFDAYDTLFANSPEKWQEAFAEIVAEQGLPLDGPELWRRWKVYEVDFRKTRTNMEDPDNNPPFRSYEQAWADCFERVFADGSLPGDAAAAAKRSVEHMSRRDPFPEMLEAIRALDGRTKLAVFSNADDAFLMPMLEEYDLPFESVNSSESARIYKPHPAAYRYVLDKIGVPAARAWYVGDHLWDDVHGASRVGMTTVWINRESAEFDGLTRPDIEIKSLTELSDLISHPGYYFQA
ncbi:MAG: HAD family hydrolase [Chloroflexi bacterium]|nr:HAD family hydrolase [Chloroflexota bacterium]